MTAEFIENIEDFLNGKMDREDLEKIAKEQGISNLDEEIEWFKDSLSAIRAAGLRDQLKEILPKPQKEAKIRRLGRNRWIIGIAASVLLIVIAYFGFVDGNNSTLYAKYEFVDPGLPVLMSQSEDFSLYDAMSYYGEGNYTTAEEKLLQLEAASGANDTVSYYLGASQLYLGKAELAINALQQVADQEESKFNQRAQWLIVLTALKSNELAEAQDLLETVLENPEHTFYEDAQELQKELRQ
jgi:hypothetical protein